MSDTSIDTRYNETVEIHPIFGVLILGMIGLLIYLSTTIPGGIPQRIMAFIILVLGFIYGNFMKLQINITSTKLTVGFGFIKRRIIIRDIEYVEARNPPWYMYGGYGIRFGWNGSIAFIQNYNTGVMVKPRKGWKLFFSSKNPEEIVDLITELREKQ